MNDIISAKVSKFMKTGSAEVSHLFLRSGKHRDFGGISLSIIKPDIQVGMRQQSCFRHSFAWIR